MVKNEFCSSVLRRVKGGIGPSLVGTGGGCMGLATRLADDTAVVYAAVPDHG